VIEGDIVMRLRHAAAFCLTFAVVPVSASLADDTPPNPLSPVGSVLAAVSGTPDGWTKNLDGSYRQAASNILCPDEFKGYTLKDVGGSNDPHSSVVGICHYTDDAGHFGSIRIRSYPDSGDIDAGTVANDKTLMEANAPPMLMRASSDRRTGNSRLTVTLVRNKYLVDCSVSQIGHERPKSDFPLYCTTIPSGN
jgi:hypothetical protein